MRGIKEHHASCAEDKGDAETDPSLLCDLHQYFFTFFHAKYGYACSEVKNGQVSTDQTDT